MAVAAILLGLSNLSNLYKHCAKNSYCQFLIHARMSSPFPPGAMSSLNLPVQLLAPHEILKEEVCAPASEVKDITYAWSKNLMDNYGLLADIMGVNEYDDLTGIATYVIPNEPASYDPNILDTTLTHTRKQMEEEWDLVWTPWFIRKGFLHGVVDNLRDALDEQFYSQLRRRLTAYRNITP